MEPNNANPSDEQTVKPLSEVQNPEQAPPADGAQVQDPAAVTQSTTAPAPGDENPEDVDKSGGVEDGTVEKTNEALDIEVRNRIEHEEKIVQEKDDNGNVVGFHKESLDPSVTEEHQKVVLQPGAEDPEGEKAAAEQQAQGGNQ